MEASPSGEPEPQPKPRGQIRLDSRIIQIHLTTNKPVNPETAHMIYVMQQHIDEWDPNFGLGIARDEEW